MRIPNPPRVMLQGLTEDQVRKIVKLGLLVVADLAAGRDYDAYGAIERTELSLEERLAFGSLLDSEQASRIVGMREAAK